jgi:signal transduction histidine kinase
MLRVTVRSLVYLVGSMVAGPVTFFWSLASTVVVGVVSLTQLGGPVFLGASWVTRRFAHFERLRAVPVLGSKIDSPYVPVTADSMHRRVTGIAAQPATWRDLAWLTVLFPLSLVLGIPAIVLTVISLALASAPLWAWSVPNPNAPFPMGLLMLTAPGRFLLAAAGLLLLPIVIRLARVLALAQARTARALLAPGQHRSLVNEAARLSESRRRVVDAQAAELRRIERDLHDGAQARIVAAGMTLALASRKLGSGHPAIPDFDLARRQLDDALGELRRLVRGIHPPILTDRGLHAAVTALAGDSSLPVQIGADPAQRFPAAVESAIYFVIAEGLVNAAKHADAANCVIAITSSAERATVIVTDDGRGGADPDGSGLDGLRRRVEALDGDLTITSPAGGPTALHAEIPL